MSGKIQVLMPSGEGREAKLRDAIEKDKQARFELPVASSGLLGDIRFQEGEKVFNVELKDFTGDNHSDYVASIRDGHLWSQVTAAREAGEPYVVAPLGDDHDIQGAVRKAAGFRPSGRMDHFDFRKFEQYSAMVDGFEANCIGANIQIWKLGYNQFPRLLLRVRKIFDGGDLSGFAPSPANGERQAVGASILFGRGFGPAKAKSILESFDIRLVPRVEGIYLDDCPGIGHKLAEMAGKALKMNPGMIHRPKIKKPKKAHA